MPGLGFGPLGIMPLGGDSSALQAQIDSPISSVFRRAAIQRRSKTTGNFDGVWKDITEYVKQWGTMDAAIDDIKLNTFTHNGVNLTVRNDTGAFNSEIFPNSLWNGYLTRYKTLLRIEAGYLVNGVTELPATSTMGIFVMDDEIDISSDSNDVALKAASLKSIFDEVRAADIAGFGPAVTQTASFFMTIIQNHTDGAGNFIFRSFITSTAWTIQATTNSFVLNTTTNLDGLTTWDLMEKLAEAEGFVVLINRQGGLDFTDRNPNTTASQFSFYGQDFPRQNLIAIHPYREAYNKYFNVFRLQYLEADTSTSFVTAGTVTSVSNSNPSWIFGQRIYQFENTFVANTATAQTIVNNLFTTFGTMTSEATLRTTFVPHIDILDRIDVSFHAYDLAGSTIWDTFDWAPDTGDTGAKWSAEGENFDWNGRQFVVLSRNLNLDDFTMEFKVRDLTP